MLWLNKYVYATKKLKHCKPFTGFNLVPYEYDEHECNTVMVLDHDKLFCVSVGERASSVDDINSMTQIPEERESSLLDLHFKQYESHWDLISVFVQERKMAVTLLD